MVSIPAVTLGTDMLQGKMQIAFTFLSGSTTLYLRGHNSMKVSPPSWLLSGNKSGYSTLHKYHHLAPPMWSEPEQK